MNSNEPELFIELLGAKAAFLPGEEIEAHALWALPAPPQTVEARLLWYTRGKGTADVGVVATQAASAPPAAGEARFKFQLPEGPYSFSGSLISLLWAVELVAEPGAKSARVELVVGPDRAEVNLTRNTDASRLR